MCRLCTNSRCARDELGMDQGLCAHRLPSMKGTPPPVTPCGHKPLSYFVAFLLAARHRKQAFSALTRCVGFRICPLAKYPGPAGRLMPTSLRSTYRTARDATPVAWGLPDQPGSKRAILRAPMALKIARLAAADQGNGRRRCPQAHQTIMPDDPHLDHPAGGADYGNGRRR